MGNAKGLSRSNCAILALILLAPSPAAAEQCLPYDQLEPDETPRDFRQLRHVPSLSKPLLSAGVMAASDSSLVWQVCNPFDIRTVIDADGVTQSVEGEPATAVGPDMLQDMIRQISIADIFRGRFDQLENVFDIDPARPLASDGNWKVALTPRAEAVSSIVSRIDVEGCRTVDRIRISYRSGGWDDIQVGPGLTMKGPARCPTE